MSDAGEIVGRLRLDSGNWFEELDRAEGKARELGTVDPKVRVSADTAGAIAGLKAVAASADSVAAAEGRLKSAVQASDRATAIALLAQMRLEEVQNKRGHTALQVASAEEALRFATQKSDDAALKAIAAEDALAAARKKEAAAALEEAAAVETVGKKQKDGQKDAVDWQKVLIGGLIAVSAAAPPVAAAAVGIAGAFGVMGAAGVLGIAGIVRGMKDGTAVGESYRGVVGDLTGDLHTLEDTAAKNLLPGVQQAVDQLHGQMPGLADAVGHFAGMLGNIIPTGLDAVVNLLERGMPLFDAAGQYVISLVDGLDRFSTSNGYSDFIAYSVANLPNVESFLGTLVGTVGDFLAAWAPLGAVTLPLLTGLLGALDGIIQHTGPLVPLVVTLLGGFMAWKGIAPVIAGIGAAIDIVTGALAGMDVAEAVATGGLSLLLGAAAAGGTIALLSSSGVKAPGGTGAATPARSGGHSAPAATGGDTSYNGFGASTTANSGASSAAATAAASFNKESGAVRGANAALNAQVAAANAAANANQKAATSALAVEQADDSAKDAISGLTAAVKQNGTSLAQNTDKGRANREQFASAVSSIQAAGTAYQKAGHSSGDARIKMDELAVSLQNQAVKAGFSRKAAADLISKLMGFPKGVTASIDLKTAKAENSLTNQKKALADFVNGDYTAALKADPSNMKAKVADAQGRANAMAHAQYLAFLKANPANANSNSADAARKARAFAAGAYMASLRADAAPALAAARSTVAQINAMRASISVSVTAVGGNGAQVAKNALLGAHGGTTGAAGFGSIPHLAGGGTIRGAGTAATDQAGIYALANSEEVVSNLWGGASTFRPLLKGISAGKVRTRADALQALGGGRSDPQRVDNSKTITLHIHGAPGQSEQALADATLRRLNQELRGA